MEVGISVGLSGQIATEQRLTSLAQNVANSRTVGFRATEIRFDEVLKKADDAQISMVSEGREFISSRTGGLEKTGNTLDFAIAGDAWFSVQTDAGNVMTKDGRFTVNNVGGLTTLSGKPVLDAGGAPIQLDPTGGPVQVGTDGSIVQNSRQVAGLGLYSFEPGLDFVRYGESAFIGNASVAPIVDRSEVGVMQGYVEQSNVNPIQEITRLITVQRGFEQNAAAVEKSEDSLQRLIQAMNKG